MDKLKKIIEIKKEIVIDKGVDCIKTWDKTALNINQGKYIAYEEILDEIEQIERMEKTNETVPKTQLIM